MAPLPIVTAIVTAAMATNIAMTIAKTVSVVNRAILKPAVPREGIMTTLSNGEDSIIDNVAPTCAVHGTQNDTDTDTTTRLARTSLLLLHSTNAPARTQQVKAERKQWSASSHALASTASHATRCQIPRDPHNEAGPRASAGLSTSAP